MRPGRSFYQLSYRAAKEKRIVERVGAAPRTTAIKGVGRYEGVG
jgi:hypothetical protein